MALTYATWNPSDKYTGVTLSGGNLIATHDASTGNYETVRSTIGKSSGKWYWEVVLSIGGIQGVSNTSFVINNLTSQYVGITSNGWGYFASDGKKVTNNSFVAYGATYTTEVIGFALDMDAGTLTAYKNNVSQGVMYTGLTGTLYPTSSMNGGATSTVTANFGATALAYSPPTGFNAGLYDGTANNSGFFAFFA